MSRFAMVTEDPSYLYDEDGFCVDEDADWEDDGNGEQILWDVAEKPQSDELSPFGTINS